MYNDIFGEAHQFATFASGSRSFLCAHSFSFTFPFAGHFLAYLQLLGLTKATTPI
jgi:hypothetical protein